MTYFAFYSSPDLLTIASPLQELPPYLSIYPNPAEDELHVAGIAATKGRYRIFDSSGRMVQAGTLNIDNIVNTSHLTGGMYIIGLDTPGGSGSRKFVVK